MVLFSVRSLAQQAPFPDNGNFRLHYEPASNEDEQKVERLLKDHDGVTDILGYFNDNIRLQQDVWVVFAPWSDIESRSVELEPNAAYDSSSREILISYGFFIDIIRRFQSNGYIDGNAVDFNLEDEFAIKVFPNVMHTLTHEVVHAMVDVNGIGQGTTCEEMQEDEKWADEVSVLIMRDFDYPGFSFAPVVLNFELEQREADAQGGASAIQRPGCVIHPESYVRARQYICWLYGQSPDKYRGLIDDPQNWQHCQAEYEALENLWAERLEPFLK